MEVCRDRELASGKHIHQRFDRHLNHAHHSNCTSARLTIHWIFFGISSSGHWPNCSNLFVSRNWIQHTSRLHPQITLWIEERIINWHEYLKKGLRERGFVPSNVDPWIFYRKDTIVLVCVDDCIIIAKEKGQIDVFQKCWRTDPRNLISRMKDQYATILVSRYVKWKMDLNCTQRDS